MMIGTGPANAKQPGQFFGGHSPAGPVTSIPGDSFRYHEVPIETISEELPSKRLGRDPVPLLLGNSSITPVHHKPAGSHKRREDFAPALAGCPVPLTQPETAYILIHSPIIPKGSVSDSQLKLGEKVTPGYGVEKPICGTVGSRSERAHVVCPDDPKHYTRVVYDSCHRPECPVCWSSWADRAADRAADTILGFRTAHDYPWYPNHIDITPPPDIVPFSKPSSEALTWLLEEVNARLDVMGVVAASVIAHPYRIRKDQKKFVNDGASAAKENRYVWALRQANWFDLVYFSPHAHALIYGRLIPSPEFQRLTGWQYHNHGRTRTRDDVIRVVRYLLSHAWVRSNPKAVRNLRGMSSTKLLVTQVKTAEPDLCPVCKAHAVRVPCYGRDADGNPIVPYQNLHNADKAYRVVMKRTVLAKSPLSVILVAAAAAAAIWRSRHDREFVRVVVGLSGSVSVTVTDFALCLGGS